jgi:hypothetical protein
LITECAFPDIPSPTTPCAPVFRRYFLLRAGLASASLSVASGGSSDFALCSQSRQSHKAVSSLCRGPYWPVSSTDYPFVSSCSPRPVARTQLLSTRGGKHRHRGTSTLLCTLNLKRTSATVSVAAVGVPPTAFCLCYTIPIEGFRHSASARRGFGNCILSLLSNDSKTAFLHLGGINLFKNLP